MAILDKLLVHLKANGSRVLLFSQMSRMLDILEDYCLWKGYDYCRIDGQTSHDDRIQSIDEFNKPNSSKFIFLLTTRAGGLGINLATADIVIMYDSDWNPQVDLQAEDRAHRIGQKKQVVVFRFITENAIEEKVIERATQKLRLDQLVIQQGKTQQSKAASKDELLSMIQYGANEVMQSGESTITDDDIEKVLLRGEKKTQELENKYAKVGLEDLQKFTSDTGNAYEWEGHDFSTNKKKVDIGLTWIQPAKRERKANYAVDDYYREALRVSNKSSTPKPPKPPKLHNTYDFQFYPKKLYLLHEKEIYAYRKSINYKVPVVIEDDEEVFKEKEKEREEEQKKIDEAEPLTEEEIAEKEKLLGQGFEKWGKRDFTTFIKANEKYGRNNIEQIANDLDGKTFEEVEEYSKVFWKRYKELNDYEKIISNIEKGEAKLQKIQEIQDMLTAKISSQRNPLQQLKIPYHQNKGRNYTEDEDRYLLVTLERLGYGTEDVHEKIRQDCRNSPLFRFDWFMKSRTAAEIGRRCNTLISLITKETEVEEKEPHEDRRRRGKRASETSSVSSTKKRRH
jgi:SWI/SNF-related matrix-associated actin-dependent regulator of chromatin subfamily A member 5